MNKNTNPSLGKTIALLTCFGLAASLVFADNPTQIIAAKVLTATNSCCGKYYAYATLTNSVGNIWIKPPTNIVVHSGTFSDVSGYAAPYGSYATVLKLGAATYSCASNSITFPATNNAQYQMMVVITSHTTTNNQPITLSVNWQ